MERRRLLEVVAASAIAGGSGCLERLQRQRCQPGEETIQEAFDRLEPGGEGWIEVGGEVTFVDHEMGLVTVDDGTGRAGLVDAPATPELQEGDCVLLSGDASRPMDTDEIELGVGVGSDADVDVEKTS